MRRNREPRILYNAEETESRDEPSQDADPSVILRTVDSFGFAKFSHLLTFDAKLSDGAKILYLALLYHARQQTHLWAGEQTLADELGVSRRTITQRISELSAGGFISREPRMGRSTLTYVEDLGTIYDLELSKIPLIVRKKTAQR